jgi:hypothetical protein
VADEEVRVASSTEMAVLETAVIDPSESSVVSTDDPRHSDDAESAPPSS